jgi:5-methylthioadenosine/S-adenosylhomocysteine deaminase
MVAGQVRKRAGKLVGVDVAKTADVTASRDYLLAASGYRPNFFQASAAKTAA